MPQREGYLFVDHRASPGFDDTPEGRAMARRMGGRAGQKLIENATLTCCHCKTVVIKNPFRTRERNVCYKCGCRYVCDFCAFKMQKPDYVHAPMEKIVEEALKGG
jgi:hypothetical protein